MYKYDKETIEALEGSIKKWRKIMEESGIDKNDENCPLCKKFIINSCIDCPVYKKTGAKGCSKTPYIEWKAYFLNNKYYNGPHVVIDEFSYNLAKNELNFLKDLLEEINKKEKKTYEVGQFFIDTEDDNAIYILSEIEPKRVCLVNITPNVSYSGVGYDDRTIKVDDAEKITEEEFIKITDGDSLDFKLINNISITYSCDE